MYIHTRLRLRQYQYLIGEGIHSIRRVALPSAMRLLTSNRLRPRPRLDGQNIVQLEGETMELIGTGTEAGRNVWKRLR